MAYDINVITVTGNVGREPELRTMPDGTALLTFSLANNQYSKGAGDSDTLTTWYSVSMFGKRAEGLAKFLEKGMGVTVTGSHLMRPYRSKDGDERLSCDIRATDVRVDRGSKGDGEQRQSAPSRPVASGRRNEPQPIEDDDDIPF